MSEQLDQLTRVFQDLFEDDELTLTRETTAQDIEGWDSLMHVSLIINIERAFGIKFRSSEVAALKNVGDLLDLLEARQGGKVPEARK